MCTVVPLEEVMVLSPLLLLLEEEEEEEEDDDEDLLGSAPAIPGKGCGGRAGLSRLLLVDGFLVPPVPRLLPLLVEEAEEGEGEGSLGKGIGGRPVLFFCGCICCD